MIENAAATLSLLAIVSLGLGWYLGFRSVSSYLAFWLLSVLVGFTASRIVRRVCPWAGAADAALRIGTVAFALVVLAGFALGATGLIGLPAYVIVAVAGWGAALVVKTPRRSPI